MEQSSHLHSPALRMTPHEGLAGLQKNNLLAIASEEMLKIWSLPVDTLAAATVQSDSARPALAQTKGCIGARP